MQFADICLISENVPRLREFYEAVFQARGEGDEYHVSLALEGLTLVLDAAEPLRASDTFGYVSGESSNNTILGFDVEDVDAEYSRLASLGVAMLSKPTTHPWGARSFQFKDPDGNILNLRTLPK